MLCIVLSPRIINPDRNLAGFTYLSTNTLVTEEYTAVLIEEQSMGKDELI